MLYLLVARSLQEVWIGSLVTVGKDCRRLQHLLLLMGILASDDGCWVQQAAA